VDATCCGEGLVCCECWGLKIQTLFGSKTSAGMAQTKEQRKAVRDRSRGLRVQKKQASRRAWYHGHKDHYHATRSDRRAQPKPATPKTQGS
jgi:hypothetical protein